MRMRFEPDAQQLFFSWLGELEAKVRMPRGLPLALIGHLSKYRKLMPSLAGLFELADRAANDGVLHGEVLISLNHARTAAAVCEYLEGHAYRAYACVISPEIRSAHELARRIKCGDLKSSFETRTVYLKGWAGLDSPDRARCALALLEEAGWVRRARTAQSPSGGRPPETWHVNPKVLPHAQ